MSKEKSTVGRVPRQSLDIPGEKRRGLHDFLRRHFPETLVEDAIDFEALKAVLGQSAPVDPQSERFGLDWAGRRESLRAVQEPSAAALRPQRDQSMNFDDTSNLFLEGDNLLILKLLQRSYASQIKMIYIDPPYNTGQDFIYPDHYGETLQTYLEYTGQVDGKGRRFSTNPETDGRFHSKWLNMMFPRLYLARHLLADDGVIFISIDDHEVAHLRKLCDLIFGEKNFVNTIIWQKKYAPANDAKWLSDNHDFILCYARDKDIWRPGLLPRGEGARKLYKNPDNDPRGDWKTGDLSVKTYSKAYDYPITTPSGRVVHPPKYACWRYSKEKFQEMVADNRIWFGKDGRNVPSIKRFLSEVKEGVTPMTIWTYQEVGHNQDAKKELKDLFADSDLPSFDTPKPTSLLKRILQIGGAKDGLVLDFFAGSGSLAQAVMELNAEDGGRRHFIIVQLPEPIKEHDSTIADIGRRRIQRAGVQIHRRSRDELEMFSDIDWGFRSFTLAPSCFKTWDGDVARQGLNDSKKIARQIEMHAENLHEGWNEEDMLFELILKAGYRLDVSIDKRKIEGKTVYYIDFGRCQICLEDKITDALMDRLADGRAERVIVLERSFGGDDALKSNIVQNFRSRKGRDSEDNEVPILEIY